MTAHLEFVALLLPGRVVIRPGVASSQACPVFSFGGSGWRSTRTRTVSPACVSRSPRWSGSRR
jgi:hypothetical protein